MHFKFNSLLFSSEKHPRCSQSSQTPETSWDLNSLPAEKSTVFFKHKQQMPRHTRYIWTAFMHHTPAEIQWSCFCRWLTCEASRLLVTCASTGSRLEISSWCSFLPLWHAVELLKNRQIYKWGHQNLLVAWEKLQETDTFEERVCVCRTGSAVHPSSGLISTRTNPTL